MTPKARPGSTPRLLSARYAGAPRRPASGPRGSFEAGVPYSFVLSGSIRGGTGMTGSDSTKGEVGMVMLRR